MSVMLFLVYIYQIDSYLANFQVYIFLRHLHEQMTSNMNLGIILVYQVRDTTDGEKEEPGRELGVEPL